jgi:protein O-GlcNAc transferase
MAFIMDIPSQMIIANEFLRTGDIENAVKHFESILLRDSSHIDALHLLGLAYHYSAHNELAQKMIVQAIKLKPDHPEIHKSLGKVYLAKGELSRAERCFFKVIDLNPKDAGGWYELGKITEAKKNRQQAILHYLQAVNLDSSYIQAIYKLALCYYESKDYQNAIDWLKVAVEIKPEIAPIYNALGLAYRKTKMHDKALKCFKKALDIQPQLVVAYNNMGLVLKDLGKIEKALLSFQEAITIDNNYAEAYYNAGNTAYQMGRMNTAIGYFQKALLTKKDFSEAQNYLGIAYQYQGKYEDAINCFCNAIQSDHYNEAAYYNLTLIFYIQRRFVPAVDCIQKLISFNPNNNKIYFLFYEISREICDWKKLSTLTNKLDDLTQKALKEGLKPEESPFLNITRSNNMGENLLVAKSWSAEIDNLTATKKLHLNKKRKKKITVGYLSDGFRDHPATHLISDIFKYHNRSKFNAFCYSYGENDYNKYRLKIEKQCDRFIDVQELDDSAIADQIYIDKCDIIVDLKGYTAGNRIKVYAYRPAPIQVRYLGMPGTTGAFFFDYLITDKIVTPPKYSEFYTEKFAYIPNCYQVNSPPIATEKKVSSRTDVGLSLSGFVFCSFCTSYKINAEIFNVWMNILNRVPKSYLWLLSDTEVFAKNIIAVAIKKGINSNRIIFAERCSREAHLHRLQYADIALDTNFVNGAATTSEALWAGIPVITLKGKHFASRMSASILHTALLDELVCKNIQEYEDIAVDFAKKKNELLNLKAKIKRNHLKKTLFNTKYFVENLEQLYERMWNNYINNGENSLIDLDEKKLLR